MPSTAATMTIMMAMGISIDARVVLPRQLPMKQRWSSPHMVITRFDVAELWTGDVNVHRSGDVVLPANRPRAGAEFAGLFRG